MFSLSAAAARCSTSKSCPRPEIYRTPEVATAAEMHGGFSAAGPGGPADPLPERATRRFRRAPQRAPCWPRLHRDRSAHSGSDAQRNTSFSEPMAPKYSLSRSMPACCEVSLARSVAISARIGGHREFESRSCSFANAKRSRVIRSAPTLLTRGRLDDSTMSAPTAYACQAPGSRSSLCAAPGPPFRISIRAFRQSG